MIKWFINILKRWSYRYVSGLTITSIILVIFSYLFQPLDYSHVKYLNGYVSELVPYEETFRAKFGGVGRVDRCNMFIVGVEKPFCIFDYDEAEKYGISNIVNKKVTIGYYNYYNSSDNESCNNISIIKIGSHTIYSEKPIVSARVFWMVLGLTIFSCFMLVWGIWQRLKEDFSS